MTTLRYEVRSELTAGRYVHAVRRSLARALDELAKYEDARVVVRGSEADLNALGASESDGLRVELLGGTYDAEVTSCR